MMSGSFALAATPRLKFGRGKLRELTPSIKSHGPRVLLVSGARSFLSSSQGEQLLQEIKDAGIDCACYPVPKEPTPFLIDDAVKKFAAFHPGCVVAIGGGSALDAGKAISAMMPLGAPVKDYLEGVGRLQHPGKKIPFIAIPTTSGTGSEATKNAVISETGPNGYKRSLRHDNFVPDLAVVDPDLTAGCPRATTASSGMDAFTQLLESFVSTASNPVTDSLALEGIRLVSRSLLPSYRDADNADARIGMALAAYLSGITLANAGLGLVHGFASPIGGYFDIPHGVICSTLMMPCNKITIRKLRAEGTNPEALRKYAIAGQIVSEQNDRTEAYYIDALLGVIDSWTHEMKIDPLSAFGVTPNDFMKIVDNTDNKNNPAKLTPDEMMEVLSIAG